MPSSENPDPRQLGKYYAMAQVGVEMVVPIVLGWWLDERLATAPWLLVVGVFGGLALGIVHLVLLTRDENSNPPKDSKP